MGAMLEHFVDWKATLVETGGTHTQIDFAREVAQQRREGWAWHKLTLPSSSTLPKKIKIQLLLSTEQSPLHDTKKI